MFDDIELDNDDDLDDEEGLDVVDVYVTVMGKSETGLLVSDGDTEGLVSFRQITDESEICHESEIGDEGTLFIPQELAEELGFV